MMPSNWEIKGLCVYVRERGGRAGQACVKEQSNKNAKQAEGVGRTDAVKPARI